MNTNGWTIESQAKSFGEWVEIRLVNGEPNMMFLELNKENPLGLYLSSGECLVIENISRDLADQIGFQFAHLFDLVKDHKKVESNENIIQDDLEDIIVNDEYKDYFEIEEQNP